MNNLCLIRNTFGDRSPFLKLSLEYQDNIRQISSYNTWIFIDPYTNNTVDSSYNSAFFNRYSKYVFENHKGRQSWYLATKYIFDNYQYDYVLSIEDDIILSYDYMNLCSQIIEDKILLKDSILYLHPGAWEKPKGDPNIIVYSGISSRSILIHRDKFNIIEKYIKSNSSILSLPEYGNDGLLSQICKTTNHKPIAPICNRHGHFGVYGWSCNGIHANNNGYKSIFNTQLTHDQLYHIIKSVCLDGHKLSDLNLNRNPKYFWDFDPNINFTTLRYNL